MLKGELAFSLAIFVAAFALFWMTGSFPKQDTIMGPSFWPRIVLGALLLLTGIAAAGTIRRIVRTSAWREPLMAMDRSTLRFFAAVGLGCGYLFLMPLLGFIVTTPLFMIAFMLLLGERSKGWMVGVSAAMTAIIIILFTKAMYVPLPRGQGLFRQFSLWFY